MALFDLGQALEALPEYQSDLGRRPQEMAARKEGPFRGVVVPTTLAAVEGLVGEDDTCPFCMEGLADDVSVKQAKCGHVFHDVCISTWVSDCYRNDSCPLCRCKIVYL